MNNSWSEQVFALRRSRHYKGTYRIMLGEYTVDSARKIGAEYYLKEDKSGVFALGRTGSGLPVNAHHMRIFCPWHEGVDIYCEQLITRPSSAHNATRDSKNYYKTGG